MPSAFRKTGPLGSSTNPTGGRLSRSAFTGSAPEGFAVRFGLSSGGEPILVELERGKPVREPTFETKGGRAYYRKGDLIGRGKHRWATVVQMYPEFSDIDPPISEASELKILGLFTGEFPEYEVGFRIEEIIPAAGNPFEGTVVVKPYVMLTPEQSGEEKKTYFLSDKSIPLPLDRSGGQLNQFFVVSQIVKRLDAPGGGQWFAKLSVTVTKEVLSHVGRVFTAAAKQALKHALATGAKKVAENYAKKYVAEKGREAAVKRIVRKVFARLAKLAALFDHAAVQAAGAFVNALAVELLYQTKKDIRLLAAKGAKGTNGAMVSSGAYGEVVAGQKADVGDDVVAANFNFSVLEAGGIDWKGAFWKGIVAAISAAVAALMGDKIKEYLKFNNDLDQAIAKELGDDGVHKGIRDQLEQAFRSNLAQELWTNNATMIIAVVAEVAEDQNANATNFSNKLTQKLKDKVIERLKKSFAGIPAMIVGQEK